MGNQKVFNWLVFLLLLLLFTGNLILFYEILKLNDEIFSLKNEIGNLSENIKNGKDVGTHDQIPFNIIILGALGGLLIGAFLMYANPGFDKEITGILGNLQDKNS